MANDKKFVVKNGLHSTGDITVTGTVDGRDVATDGTKLDNIEAGAAADQTGAEIKAAYEAETSAFTDAQFTKLGGIEASATADQTGAEIKAAYEAETSAFTDAQFTKLDGIEASATADQTGAEIKAAYEAETSAFTDAQFTKLDGIETAATADQTGAEIKAAYEAETSAFTDAQFTKLDGIEAGADVTDTTNVVAALTGGTNVTIAANGTISSTDTNTTYSVGDGGLTQVNFTTADNTKLDGIEALATADQTGAEIKAAYEAETSAFTDAQFTKLGGIEASADVTDTTNVVAALTGGTNVTIAANGTISSTDTNTDTLQSITANATDATQYITFVPNTTGAQAGRVDAGLTYNPSTNNLIIGNDLTVGGNLLINGETTTVNSTTVTIDDPTFTLGGDTAPSTDDNKDRGIEFNYFDTTAKVGFFGLDDSTGKFTFIPDATNTGEVFTGTTGEIDAKVDWTNVINAPVSADGTNLSNTANGTSLTVESSTGTNTALPAATTSAWGVMTDEMFDELAANTLKETNVSTNLGYTTAASNGTVTSSDGTNATLPAATISLAGLLTGTDKTKLDGIEAAATADQTGAEIKAAYEAETSAFTDAQFTKLGGIEAAATADQTGAEIKAAYEAETSAFTDAQFTKLDGIEASATADQTGAEIKAAYEAETSAFTDAQFTKLGGIEASADVTDTTNVVAALTGGTNVTIAANGTISSVDTNTTYSVGDGGLTQVNFTTADNTKLDGIEASATADQTGAEIKAAYEAETSAFTDAQFTKLGGIETAATADQTGAEIKAAYEAETSAFTDAQFTKLGGIETAATADQTGAEIKAAYEAETSAFTDAQFTKLGGIEASADVTDTTNVVAALTGGTNVTIAANGTISSVDTNTTYVSGDFDHDDLTGFVAAEHVNWAASSAGTIHLTNLPATALTSVQTASSQVAMLALDTQEGDVVVRSDELKTYMHNGGTANNMNDFTLLATPTDAVTSVDGATGVVTLNHDTLSGFVANEHIDWTLNNASDINAGNYTNTTYSVGDGGLTQINFTTADNSKLDGIEAGADVTDTTNVVASLTGGTNVTIAANGTISSVDTNTTYSVGDGGLTQINFTTADNSKLDGIEAGADVTDTTNVVAALTGGTNVTIAANGTISSVDTNTTYSVGDGGLTQVNFTTADNTKLDGIEALADVTDTTNVVAALTAGTNVTIAANGTISSVDTNTVYTHPTHPGDDAAIDTGPLSGATVISDLDLNITTDTLGHVTDANATVATRTLTLANLGYTGATDANNYSLPLATSTVRGGIELFSTTDQATAPNAVTATASRTYGLQLNAANQAMVNVPWTDTNTTYSDGTGITQVGTVFSVVGGTGITADAGGVSLTANGVTASQLNVVGNGTTAQFLRADGDGSFTWATPTDTNTTYSDGTGITQVGTVFSVVGGTGITADAGGVSLSPDSRFGNVDVTQGNSNDYTFYDADIGIRWYTATLEEMRLTDAGDLHVDGDVTAYSATVSDIRMKSDIVKIDNALDKISQLNGYTFTYTHDGRKSAGVIAQEVEMVLPSAIKESTLPLINGDDDDTKYKTVNYDQLHGVMIEAIKELKAEIDELKRRLDN